MKLYAYMWRISLKVNMKRRRQRVKKTKTRKVIDNWRASIIPRKRNARVVRL